MNYTTSYKKKELSYFFSPSVGFSPVVFSRLGSAEIVDTDVSPALSPSALVSGKDEGIH